MMRSLEFTGERFVPDAPGEIAQEHTHRYAFARRFVAGRRVLDAACGEGYGSALLGAAAAEVTGLDIDVATIAHARARYVDAANVRFEVGSVLEIPCADASFSAIVSFETIEHLEASDQPRMLAEFARVLGPGGLLILSSPNKRRYSDELDHRNPFHRHELYRNDLARLLDPAFPHRRWFHQQPCGVSTLWADGPSHATNDCEAWTGDPGAIEPMVVDDGLYHLIVATASPEALPPPGPRLSLYADRGATMLAQARADAREVLRQDALLKERDAGLARQTEHIRHLERLVGERERIVVERDAQLVELNCARESLESMLHEARAAGAALERQIAAAADAVDESRHALDDAGTLVARREAELATMREMVAAAQREVRSLEAALLAQERMIAYQQGLRWWLQLPWLRMKRGLQRRAGR